METQTQTTETVSTENQVETEPVSATVAEGEGDTAAAVTTAEVAVTEKQESPKLTPVTGVAGLLLVGVAALVVARWRKKD